MKDDPFVPGAVSPRCEDSSLDEDEGCGPEQDCPPDGPLVVGNVAQLNSGGPLMTVLEINPSTGWCQCTWFYETGPSAWSGPHHGHFHPDCLTKRPV